MLADELPAPDPATGRRRWPAHFDQVDRDRGPPGRLVESDGLSLLDRDAVYPGETLPDVLGRRELGLHPRRPELGRLIELSLIHQMIEVHRDLRRPARGRSGLWWGGRFRDRRRGRRWHGSYGRLRGAGRSKRRRSRDGRGCGFSDRDAVRPPVEPVRPAEASRQGCRAWRPPE